MHDAREVVIRHVARRAKRWPDMPVAEVEAADLKPVDLGLARAIDHTSRFLTLTALVSMNSRRASTSPPMSRLKV